MGGPATGFIAALFLFLTPRYYGHAFNNPKDIPFAVFYLWSLYYLIRCIGAFPNLPRTLIIHTGLALGFALGIRVGGVLLIAYFVLFIAIFAWQSQLQWHKIWQITRQVGAILAIAYAVMLLCWPWALTQPLTGPITALLRFSHFSEPHLSFFDGHYVVSTSIPLLYAPTWLTLTLPEFSLMGFVIGIIFLVAKHRYNLQRLLLLFAGVFPILYAVIMQTPLYDGLRHLLFAVPPLVIFAAVAFSDILKHPGWIWTRRIGLALGIFFLGLTAADMVRLHPNQYIYFNRAIAGGLKEASEKYETDYWENTFKQGIRWIETNHSPGSTPRISGFSENIQYMLNTDQFAFEGYPEQADIYIGVTRYDRHRKVPGEILHIVQVDDTPLLYLIRPDSSYYSDPFFSESHFMYARLGEIYEAEKQHEKALTALLKARDILLQKESLRAFLPQTYIQIGRQYDILEQYERALSAFGKVLKDNPQNAILHNNIGVTSAKLGDMENALRSLRKSVSLSPTYFSAHVNLGAIAALYNRLEEAEAAYRRALELDPKAHDIRKSVGTLSYQMGAFEKAAADFRKALDYQPDDPETLYNLSLALSQLEDYAGAQKSVTRAIALSPNYFDAYFTLGSIAMYLQQYREAVQAYKQSANLKPNRADVYSALGIALLAVEKFEEAQRAFEHAQELDPNDVEAKNHLQQLRMRKKP
ncbi:MAG: tetratricopeptide repeat protein [Candidatus Latescibacteria bacterium]|nr:tetratricopeptide repeat protein [Candidatus Latescibacterota bacterium]